MGKPKMKFVQFRDWMADSETDQRLIPNWLRQSDNERRRYYCKQALRSAITVRLTPIQRRRVEQHFGMGLSKTEIAGLDSTTCSTVSKQLKSAVRQMREYANAYMEIFDALDDELRREYEQ